MVFKVKEKENILQFLRDNPQLSSFEASHALMNMGITISYMTITKYRQANDIYFEPRKSLHKKLKEIIDAGLPMPTSLEIVNKYKVSRSHANKAISIAMGIKPVRRQNKVVVALPGELEPVRVNTFEHAVQQLTARKAA